MRAAPHPDEQQRLLTLDSYQILDSGTDPIFDELAAFAAELCETPIALVSLVAADRQWFKAHHGTPLNETGLDRSVCAHTILGEGLQQVPDTAHDPRTADNPLVADATGMRFYAGMPLRAPNGLPLGTLCVLDTRPRHLTPFQERGLTVLARQVMAQLDLRRQLAAREVMVREIDHRVKNSLAQVAALLRLQEASLASVEARQALAEARRRVSAIARVHATLHRGDATGRVDLGQLLPALAEDFRQTLPPGLELASEGPPVVLPVATATAIAILCNEFVANSVKHAFAEGVPGRIAIAWAIRDDGRLRLALSDDGRGHSGGASGLGTRVIDAAVAQLNALPEVTADRSAEPGADPQIAGQGTRLTVVLPIPAAQN